MCVSHYLTPPLTRFSMLAHSSPDTLLSTPLLLPGLDPCQCVRVLLGECPAELGGTSLYVSAQARAAIHSTLQAHTLSWEAARNSLRIAQASLPMLPGVGLYGLGPRAPLGSIGVEGVGASVGAGAERDAMMSDSGSMSDIDSDDEGAGVRGVASVGGVGTHQVSLGLLAQGGDPHHTPAIGGDGGGMNGGAGEFQADDADAMQGIGRLSMPGKGLGAVESLGQGQGQGQGGTLAEAQGQGLGLSGQGRGEGAEGLGLGWDSQGHTLRNSQGLNALHDPNMGNSQGFNTLNDAMGHSHGLNALHDPMDASLGCWGMAEDLQEGSGVLGHG